MQRADLRRRQNSGISFLEVLITILIATVGLMGLHAMSLIVVNSISVGRNLAVATTLGQEKIEEIKAAGYDSAFSGNYPEEDYGSIAGYPGFRRTVVINDETPESNMKTITVTVSWRNDLDGNTKQAAIPTILMDY